MWKPLILSARSQSLYNWRHKLPNIDSAEFKTQFLDPIQGYACQVMCVTSDDCQEKCGARNVRTLSAGLSACCKTRFDVKHIPLTEDDISLYQLSYARFHKAVCELFNIEFSGTDMDDQFLFELGRLKLGVGHRLPIYISYCFPHVLETKLRVFIAENPSPFILMCANRSMIKPESLLALDNAGCACLYLDDILAMNSDCSLSLTVSQDSLFEQFKPKSRTNERAEYQCAAGTKWREIHIKKRDEHNISIWMRGEPVMTVSYDQLGLRNAKSGNPKVEFSILLAFLNSPGGIFALPAKTGNAKGYDRLKHYKSALCALLKRLFPLIDDGDPILYDKETGNYIARFQTKSDTD